MTDLAGRVLLGTYIPTEGHGFAVPKAVGVTPLHHAAFSGDLSEVKRLLHEEGSDPYTKDHTGALPLHYACAVSQNLDTVKLLLTKGESTFGEQFNKTVCLFTPLHVASYCGNLDIVKYLIDQDECKVNSETFDGNTALHFSCVAGHLDISKMLIEHHANVHCRNNMLTTPLHCGTYSGHLCIIKTLASDESCDLNSQNSNQATPLHLACQKGHLSIATLLIEKGCDVNLKNKCGDTPIHIAYEGGHFNIANRIISHKQCDLNIQNENEDTPLHIACQKGCLETARLLIEKGCDVNLKNKWSNAPIHVALEGGHLDITNLIISHEQCDLNIQNENKTTPLHLACWKGHLNTAKLLSVKGCDINLKNKWNDPPIHIAYEGDHLDIINLIISHEQCDVNIQNENKSTPLHLACWKGHLNIARLLIEKGCDINFKNKWGDAPIHIAYEGGHLDIIHLIVWHKQCDPNIQNENKITPLHLACKEGHLEIARLLIEKDYDVNKHMTPGIHEDGSLGLMNQILNHVQCDLNIQSENKITPLHLACQKGHFEIAKLLIKKDCDMNLKDNWGNVPIHVAVKGGHFDIIRHIVSHKQCDLNVQNQSKSTPLHLACQEGHLEIAKLLIEKGCNINLKNKSGKFPVCVAYSHGHARIVILLMSQKQLDPDANPLRNTATPTALHLACQHGYLDMAILLASSDDCDLNNQHHDDKNTPLHVACQEGHFKIARLLIEKGCDINLRNKWDNAPIHVACEGGHFDIANHIISNKQCDLNVQNENKSTPLHLACWKGHLNTVKLLIERGCDVNLKDKHGDTALHNACIKGSLSIVVLLVFQDTCSVDIQNSQGRTPLSCACQYGHLDTVKALLSTGKVDPTSRDASGQTAAELTYDYNIVNKVSQYAKLKLEFEGQHPLGTFIQVFVTGNPATGKTTLIEVLCREAPQLMRILPKQTRLISSVKSQTAGIIPREFCSKTFGNVVIHDFAGQYQYYSSHSAVVESSILSSAPLFFVVVKLNEPNDVISDRLSFWLSFIENHCAKAITPPHVIVVGSHKDAVKALGKSLEEISSIVQNVFPTSLHFAGFIALDCRKLASRGLGKLRSFITTSCLALRGGQSIYFGCHALYAFLLNNFKDSICCSVSSIASMICYSDVLLPQTASGLVELLSAISDKGLIFLLKNSSNPEDSWVIFKKSVLISEINGTMFAPENFKEHHDFATSTGVVPLSNIKAAFPKYNPVMITRFLIHLEFCQRIQDDVTLRVINASESQSSPGPIDLTPTVVACLPKLDHIAEEPCTNPLDTNAGHSAVMDTEPISSTRHSSQMVAVNKDYSQNTVKDSEEYFLFPALISADRPHGGIWASEEYRCGWYFYCTQSRQFLNSRFLHVLLLRLAFSFALAPVSSPSKDSVVLTRRCSMWKNGIQWLSTSGVETIVEMPEQNRSVIILMQCSINKVISCAKLRSAVIQKVLLTMKDCCPKVAMDEFLIHPSELTFPLEDLGKLHHFSLKDISTVIVSNQPDETHVIDKTGKEKIAIEELLGFEPYLQIGQPIIRKLFSTDTASTHVREPHLLEVAKQLQGYATIPAYPTYRNLREVFNCFSIFYGRDLMDLNSSSIPPQPMASVTIAASLNLTAEDYLGTLLQDIDNNELGPSSLLEVRTELKEVVSVWFNLGLVLGLHQHTLESIQMQHREDVEQCLTESLAAWLQRRDGATAPNWRTIAEALLGPMVNQHRLAGRIADSHGRSGNSSQEPALITGDDPVLQDVDDAKLDESSLRDVVAAVIAGRAYFSWLHLGLALGLDYRTLKVIQNKCSDDNECLRDTLAAWLRQKDRVPQQGLPSWRSLTRALAHPLVSQRGLAEEIARKYKKIVSSRRQ